MSSSASPSALHPKFESFLNERRFVVNVSDPTLDWYRQSLKWLPSPDPTTDDLKAVVIKMREAGLKPSSVVCRLRAIRSYIRWAGLVVTVPKIRIEQRELPTFGTSGVAALLKWKPKASGQHRLSALICFLLDTGARIDEALSITWKDVNLNDCLVTLWGKGRKQRTVPFSNELRRRLYLWSRKSSFTQPTDFVFCTRQGLKQGRRNVLRDVKDLCRALGFEPPARTLHACRHSYATFFIRSGGNPLTLQRLLGHTSLEMTRRYVSLNVEDLRREHRSLLSA